jgi:hypothetical protein
MLQGSESPESLTRGTQKVAAALPDVRVERTVGGQLR